MNNSEVFIQNRCYLDCDGVLADFDAKVREIFGMTGDEAQAHFGNGVFWKTVRDYRDDAGRGFYDSLDLMPDAQLLFDAVKHLKPIILTGCPFGNWAPEQKMRWGENHFPGTRMITCMARNKIDHMTNAGDILVDDKTKFKATWEGAGGVFVHHTSSLDSLAQLRELHPIWFQRTDRWTPGVEF